MKLKDYQIIYSIKWLYRAFLNSKLAQERIYNYLYVEKLAGYNKAKGQIRITK